MSRFCCFSHLQGWWPCTIFPSASLIALFFLSPIFRKLFFVQIRSKNNLNWVDKDFFHFSLAMSVIKHFIWGEGGWILLLIYVLLFLWFYKMWERFIVWVARWIKLRHDEIKFFTNFKAFWSRNLTKKVFAYLKRALR